MPDIQSETAKVVKSGDFFMVVGRGQTSTYMDKALAEKKAQQRNDDPNPVYKEFSPRPLKTRR
jgi:hypothetical protein